MADIADLGSRIADARRPGIARAQASAKDLSKSRASSALTYALDQLRWSKRDAARHAGVNERIIRDWIEGSRQPAWIPLSLPREGYLAYLEALFGSAPQSERTGTNG